MNNVNMQIFTRKNINKKCNSKNNKYFMYFKFFVKTKTRYFYID